MFTKEALEFLRAEFTPVLDQKGLIENLPKGVVPGAVLPDGVKVQDLEQFLPKPARIREKVKLNSTESYIAYVNTFKGHSTQMFSWMGKKGFGAKTIFDYHIPPLKRGPSVLTSSIRGAGSDDLIHRAQPDWKEHTALLELELHPVFERFLEKNRVFLKQLEFAEFIEDNLMYVVEPKAADLLEIIQEMKGTRNVVFVRGERIANGETNLVYQESLSATDKTGKMKMPEKIQLSMPIFNHDKTPTDITANFRWRISDDDKIQGKLFYSISIEQVEEMINKAREEIIEVITKETGITPFWGE